MDQAQIIEEFHQGRCIRAYQLFGAHFAYEGGEGVRFTVYAPHAHSVSVIGSFNDWDGNRDRMTRTDFKGVWSVFVKGVKEWDSYKYHIEDNFWISQIRMPSTARLLRRLLRRSTACMISAGAIRNG